MKIMQILENRKIEKKLRKEIMPDAWETVEDMTGRVITGKTSVSVKIEEMANYIQGKYTKDNSIILNTTYAHNSYHSSKKEFYKWAFPLLVHEGYHYAQTHYEDKDTKEYGIFQPQVNKRIMNTRHTTKNENIRIVMKEAPAYFIGAYADSKIFVKEMNELWQNRAGLIRHKIISLLCCFSEDLKNELPALFNMIRTDEISNIDKFMHGAHKEKAISNGIALIMFAANGYSILETMNDLDKPAASIIDTLARKLGDIGYSSIVQENVYEMAKIKIRIDRMYSKFEEANKDAAQSCSKRCGFLKKLIRKEMELKTSLIYKMRESAEAQRAKQEL